MIVPFHLNGRQLKVDVEIDTMTVDLLRNELGLLSIRHKCSDFSCGNCLILVDNKPIFSCLIQVFALRHTDVWTYEGIKTMEKFPHIQQNTDFLCPICKGARSLLIEALLKKTKKPTNEEIHQLINIVQCSCTSKRKLFEAIKESVRQRILHNEKIEKKL